MKMTGAKILMECLLEQGVDTIFGYPGGTILNVYDELYNYSDKIRHILTAHEQGASHAADGYARSTGRTGVCFATSGPGATNLTTGIATAYMDSTPVVFITCNVLENNLGKDAFQEVDITGISMPITKCSYLVRDVSTLADIIREAFHLANSGRPGPVLIDMTKDVTADTANYEYLPKEEHVRHGHLAAVHRRNTHGFKSTSPETADIDRLVEMAQSAQRPMVICGGGVNISGAAAELVEFSEALDAVTACTLMGLGCMPGDHPLYTGILGMHGSRASNIAASSCDLLISVGCRFSDRVASNLASFAEQAKVIHIDIDRAEINKNVICDHHVVADAKEVLALANRRLQKQSRPGWTAQIAGLKAATVQSAQSGLQPHEIMGAIEELSEGRAVVVTDVGQHQLWSAQYYTYRHPRQLLTSGGFGTMGFGFGAAMGAKLGRPESLVVHTTGDGCFRMNCNEMATSNYYGIPIITVLFNNGTLGMVRQWQTLMYDRRYSQTTLDRGPDFVKLAEAYGQAGYRVRTVEEFTEAFRKAVESGKGALIECVLEIDEKVRPMVAGGKPLTDFILE